MFFSQFFSGFFFWGGGGAKASVILPKFFRLPYLSRKYAFSGFEKQLHIHKNYGTDFHQIWYNGASYHRTDLAFVTSKMRIKEFFFPLHTDDAYANVPNCDVLTCTLFDPLVYLFKGNCSMLGHRIPPKSTHSELTHKKPNKLLGVHFATVHRCLQSAQG